MTAQQFYELHLQHKGSILWQKGIPVPEFGQVFRIGDTEIRESYRKEHTTQEGLRIESTWTAYAWEF